jgi:hypothetical protein
MNRIRFLAVLLLCSGCSTIKGTKLWAPEWFDMEPIATRVFVDKEMPPAQRKRALELVAESEQRLVRYYGNVASTPKLFFCSTETCFRSFGGSTNRAKTFGDYGSLFSPRGLSVPILSHERSHSELYSRTGGFLTMRRVPSWFDEGLAVAVSEEPTHAESVCEEARKDGVPLPSLAELESKSQWLEAVRKYRNPELNPKNLAIVYATAGCEVRSWLRRVGGPGFRSFIEQMRSGTEFSVAYENVQSAYRSTGMQ